MLYRKTFTKALIHPRLIAGLVTALCDFSVGSGDSGVGLPVNTIELEQFSVTIVELPADDLEDQRDYLRAVLFHDTSDVRFFVCVSLVHSLSLMLSFMHLVLTCPPPLLLQGDFYGHVLGVELLKVFKTTFEERLLSMQLGNVEGVEEIFKPFGTHIRSAVKSSVSPLMQSCKCDPKPTYPVTLRQR